MYVSINDAIIKTFLLDYGYEVSNKSNISKSIENSNIGSCYNILQPCNEIATHKLQKEIQEDCNPKHLDDNDTLMQVPHPIKLHGPIKAHYYS